MNTYKYTCNYISYTYLYKSTYEYFNIYENIP